MYACPVCDKNEKYLYTLNIFFVKLFLKRVIWKAEYCVLKAHTRIGETGQDQGYSFKLTIETV